MLTKEEQREKKRDRVQSARKPNSSEYRPPTVKADHIKADDYQRVAVYARVSTDNPEQTTSFELQQKFYTEMIDRYPKWTLTKIYADEGRSGVTVEHRPEFLQMIEDAKAGKFDLIITKSVSRLNRNTEQFLATVRTLSGYNVGVYFESENVYSLNQDLRMGMEMLAMMAAQESRNRSRSMESSLQMRLDHGLPLTPELLGFRKDDEGKLVVNEETKNIPKLMFYMCLFGYSTQQIADTLIKLSKKSYLGNIKWTSGGVVNSLRNERYAGDVLTRKRFKVFAADIGADGQKTFKNNGQKPQTYYHDDHDEIVSREDYLAVQRILDNTKYGGNCRLPSLRVVPEGLLKGFVIIHPHWSNFTKEDYIAASQSVGDEGEKGAIKPEAGSFDLSSFEKAEQNLFSDYKTSSVCLLKNAVTFNKECVKAMDCGNYVELLVHPLKKLLAVRPAEEKSKCTVKWARLGKTTSISCQAFIRTLFDIFDWNMDLKYKLYGTIFRDDKNCAGIFSATDPSMFISQERVTNVPGQLIGTVGKRVQVFDKDFGQCFGKGYYEKKTMRELQNLSHDEWKTRLEGRTCLSEKDLNITPYEKLRNFIKSELGDLFEEVETA